MTRSAVDRVGKFEAYPTTVVLDRNGTVRGFWVGYPPETPGEIEALVTRLLDDKRPA